MAHGRRIGGGEERNDMRLGEEGEERNNRSACVT
jgi:hypothetical protein